jgi:enamine deaminase RidA (YjgF/YER057c/UK114 family)
LVFVAGQVAGDDHGKLVGPGDVAVQASQAFANVGSEKRRSPRLSPARSDL